MLVSSNNGIYDLCVRKSITSSISYYQKYLSPLKGFSCAYRVFHHSDSCSQYIKRVFEEQDFKTAFNLMNQRFQDCYLASQEITKLASKNNDKDIDIDRKLTDEELKEEECERKLIFFKWCLDQSQLFTGRTYCCIDYDCNCHWKKCCCRVVLYGGGGDSGDSFV